MRLGVIKLCFNSSPLALQHLHYQTGDVITLEAFSSFCPGYTLKMLGCFNPTLGQIWTIKM